jgi:hypothetical protein
MKFWFLLLMPLFIHSQKFDGYVVTNANDTINCKFFVPTNVINKRIVTIAAIYDKVKILTDKGETKEFTTKELKCFLIKATKFGDLKWVSLKYDNYERFYHEVQSGRLMFYRFYKEGTGIVIGIGFGLKDDQFVELQGPEFRERLGAFISDYPELYTKWMDSNKYYKPKQLEEVIKLYNEHFKN